MQRKYVLNDKDWFETPGNVLKVFPACFAITMLTRQTFYVFDKIEYITPFLRRKMSQCFFIDDFDMFYRNEQKPFVTFNDHIKWLWKLHDIECKVNEDMLNPSSFFYRACDLTAQSLWAFTGVYMRGPMTEIIC